MVVEVFAPVLFADPVRRTALLVAREVKVGLVGHSFRLTNVRGQLVLGVSAFSANSRASRSINHNSTAEIGNR